MKIGLRATAVVRACTDVDARIGAALRPCTGLWSTLVVGATVSALMAAVVGCFRFYHRINEILLALLALTAAMEAVSLRYLPDIHGRLRRLFPYLTPLLTVGICFAQLHAAWRVGLGSDFCIGGLVPFNDASLYYSGARTLIEFGTMNDVALHRPAGPGYYSLLLLFTGQNLQSVLTITTLLVGLSAGLASLAILRTHGFTAGMATAAGIIGLTKEFLPSVMTELPGVILGACAFYLLWTGISVRRRWLTHAGVGVLAAALTVRIGPVWIAPALAVYSGWFFRGESRYSWKNCGIGLALVTFAFMVNVAVVHAIAPGSAAGFNGNAGSSLYGLARGGVGWVQFYRDHDSLVQRGAPDREISRIAYREAWRSIRADPALLLQGVVKAYWSALRTPQTWSSALQGLVTPAVATGVLFISLVALWALWRRRQEYAHVATIAVLSVFVGMPLYGDIDMRIHAAVWPFLCAASVAGIGLLLRVLGPGREEPPAKSGIADRALLVSIGAFALIVICSPVIVDLASPRVSARQVGDVEGPCVRDTERVAVFRPSRSTFLHLKSSSTRCFVPDVRLSAFSATSGEFGGLVREGQYVGNVQNLAGRREIIFLVLDFDPSAYAGKLVAVSLKFLGTRGWGQDLFAGELCRVDDAPDN